MNTNKAYKSGVTTLSAQFGGLVFSARALFLQLISHFPHYYYQIPLGLTRRLTFYYCGRFRRSNPVVVF